MAIGIFDSGVGGLSVLSEIQRELPRADIVYFGDTKNVPYGNRTREELGALTVLGLKRLIDAGATNIVTACNSVSVSVAEPLLSIAGMEHKDVIEMVGPTARAFSLRTPMRILLVATIATIESGMYQTKLREAGHEMVSLPIPELAGTIERGAGESEISQLVFAAFEKLHVAPDALLLGCTHFPFARSQFELAMAKKAWKPEIIDPAKFVAAEARMRFGGAAFGQGAIRLLLSQESLVFRQKVESLFAGFPYTIEIV